MLSKEELARIVKDDVENLIREDKIHYENYYEEDFCDGHYRAYILLDGKVVGYADYNKEVAKGIRSANDIYACYNLNVTCSHDGFIFHTDFLPDFTVEDIVEFYLRKSGFTIEIERVYDLLPTPNLKYYIYAEVEFREDKPQYLGVSIYDIDALARSFRIPQIVEQKLGSKPRKIPNGDVIDIANIIKYHQPLLVDEVYSTAWSILHDYYVNHNNFFEDIVFKITLAYTNLFPTPYRVCYEWKMEMFHKIDCLKIELLKRLKRSS